jgi:glucosamine-phosphate N-acetyltransferase
MDLLSQLTEAPPIDTNLFIDNICTISTMGSIIICYQEAPFSILGSGTVIYEPKLIHGGKSVGHIEDIVVHDRYRSHGIAKNILNKLTELAKEHNCYKVILDCRDDLITFYEKNQFSHNGNQLSKYF